MAEEVSSRRWKGEHLRRKWDAHAGWGWFPRFLSFFLSPQPPGHVGFSFFFFQLSSFFSHFTVLFEHLPCTRWYPGCSSWTRQRSLPTSRSLWELHAPGIHRGEGKWGGRKGKSWKEERWGLGVGDRRHKQRRYFSSSNQEHIGLGEFSATSLGLWVISLSLSLYFYGHRERDKFYFVATQIPPPFLGSDRWVHTGLPSSQWDRGSLPLQGCHIPSHTGICLLLSYHFFSRSEILRHTSPYGNFSSKWSPPWNHNM